MRSRSIILLVTVCLYLGLATPSVIALLRSTVYVEGTLDPGTGVAYGPHVGVLDIFIYLDYTSPYTWLYVGYADANTGIGYLYARYPGGPYVSTGPGDWYVLYANPHGFSVYFKGHYTIHRN